MEAMEQQNLEQLPLGKLAQRVSSLNYQLLLRYP
jgi:hypothetical protein